MTEIELNEQISILLTEQPNQEKKQSCRTYARVKQVEKDARMDKVQNGEVLDMELRADAFATKYLGTQAAANALRALMEREKMCIRDRVYTLLSCG